MQQTTELETQILQAIKECQKNDLDKLAEGLKQLKIQTARQILGTIQEYQKKYPALLDHDAAEEMMQKINVDYTY